MKFIALLIILALTNGMVLASPAAVADPSTLEARGTCGDGDYCKGVGGGEKCNEYACFLYMILQDQY
jgi:hypothetical protein